MSENSNPDVQDVAVEAPVATPEKVVSPTEVTTAVTEDTPKPERTFTQAELDEIVEKRLSKEKRRFESIRSEAELYKKLVLDKRESPEPVKAPTIVEESRPKLEDFADYDAYTEALAGFKAEQKFKELESKRTQDDRQRHQQEQFSTVQNAHLERVEKIRAKYEDYDEVAHSNAVPINQVMANTIMLSDTGPELAYYLGSNIEEARRISSLPPLLAVKELGKIEMKISASPPQRQVTKAPDPITPIGGRGSGIVSDEPLSTDDINTWVRKRENQLRKQMTGK